MTKTAAPVSRSIKNDDLEDEVIIIDDNEDANPAAQGVPSMKIPSPAPVPHARATSGAGSAVAASAVARAAVQRGPSVARRRDV